MTYPNLEILESRTTFVLQIRMPTHFQQEQQEHDGIEWHGTTRDGETRDAVNLDAVIRVLKERRVIAAYQLGPEFGTPGEVLVVIVTDESGRVLVEDADGRIFPGQQVEDFIPGMAHMLQAEIMVNDEAFVLPDGSTHEPDDAGPSGVSPAPLNRSLYILKEASLTTAVVHGMAEDLQQPIDYAHHDGWLFAAPPAGAPTVVELSASRAEFPTTTLAHTGGMRSIIWYGQRKQKEPVHLFQAPEMTPIVQTPNPDAPAYQLALELCRPAVESQLVPDGLFSPAVSQRLRDAANGPSEDFFTTALHLLGVPVAAAEQITSRPEGSGPTLTLPGVTRIEPAAGVTGAIRNAVKHELMTEPRGTGLYSRYRRFMWHRPALLVSCALVQSLLGAGILWLALGPSAADLRFPAWVYWVGGSALAVDGIADTIAGMAIMNRRRAQRASSLGS